jgi:hypothetical protein
MSQTRTRFLQKNDSKEESRHLRVRSSSSSVEPLWEIGIRRAKEENTRKCGLARTGHPRTPVRADLGSAPFPRQPLGHPITKLYEFPVQPSRLQETEAQHNPGPLTPPPLAFSYCSLSDRPPFDVATLSLAACPAIPLFVLCLTPKDQRRASPQSENPSATALCRSTFSIKQPHVLVFVAVTVAKHSCRPSLATTNIHPTSID